MLVWLLACTPAFNWREVRFEGSNLKVLMPCKPDQASRQVALQLPAGPQSINLEMQGCEAGGKQFTFGRMAMQDGASATAVMRAWRLASMSAMQATSEQVNELATEVSANRASEQRIRVVTGQHEAQFMWFVSANQIYQLAVYAPAKDRQLKDVADVYFSGIETP
jgi:hypothetical protein